MFLKPVRPNEMVEIASKLKNKHSSGIDELPTSIVKMATPVLKHILSYIINNSFSFGVFPDNLKIALIKPLYKKGNPESLDSYRPISLLPAFSKIFEQAMNIRLMNFLTEYDIFNSCQHGFIKNRSTQTAIFEFITYILDLIENGDLALGMFLDLSKAYDCLDRQILIKKLELYGIRGNAKKWLVSYLDNRKQCVSITKNGKTSRSEMLQNNIGIAQGSILGPLLFIVFANDLSTIINKPFEYIVKYADDTNLITGGKKIKDLLLKSKLFFEVVTEWFHKNRLVLNKEKTNAIIFSTKQSNVTKPEIIETDDGNIAISDKAKFLGVYINENLDWSDHINSTVKKLNSICYGMRIMGKYMDERTLRITYMANFESVLKYGVMFWGRHSSTQSIFVAQKRVLRVIKKKKYLESCRGLFRNFDIMTVYAIYIYECLLFFIKNKDRFEIQSQSRYETRTLEVMYPTHRLTLTEKCPQYMCLKLFNALPRELKTINVPKVFKKRLRKFLVELEPYSLKDYCNNL